MYSQEPGIMNNAAHSLIVSLATLSLGFLTPVLFGAVDPEDQFEVSRDVYRLIVGSQGRAEVGDFETGQEGVAGVGMVIGDTPGEVLVVSGTVRIQGDLQIIGDGRVEISPTGTLDVAGTIEIFDTGALVSTGGRIELEQTYDYESQILVWDQGSLELLGGVVDGDGYSFSMAVLASVVWEGVEVTNGFATWAMFIGADVSLSDVTNAGEFLQLDASALSLVRCETVLFWLTLPDGAVVDTTLPSAGDVALFELNGSTPWATGIPYTTRIEDCTGTMWALMARDGSSATIRDSQVRAAGSIFENDDTVEINGLTNGMTMTDSSFSWGGIQTRFVNSTVQTWNLYARGQTDLRVQSCIFGEIFASDESVVTVLQSICDGTGGHIETSEQGQMFFLQSLSLTGVTVNGGSVFVAASSSFMSPAIDATGDSIVALYNSTTFGEPRAKDSGTIFLVGVNPLIAVRSEVVPITGSAKMIVGPASPFAFVSYDVEYLSDQGWIMIEQATTQVGVGVLAQWDTGAVEAGEYPIRVSLVHSVGGDPIRAESAATINAPDCVADINGDGTLNFFDVSAFLAAFGDGNPSADLTGDGVFDFFDISAFLSVLAAGCP